MTILHFDMPLNLAEKYGGWINRKLIEFYLNFASTLFERWKTKVKYWITVNEINVLGGYLSLIHIFAVFCKSYLNSKITKSIN